MAKHLKLIISLLSLILIALPLSSKERDVCPMLTFEGEVVKNKTTKQKEPSGSGVLSVANYNESKGTYTLKIYGSFNGESIKNGLLYLNGNKIYNGDISYKYSYDKNSKRLTLSLNLFHGTLYVLYGYRDKQEYQLPINAKNEFSYSISAEKRNGNKYVYSIKPSKPRLYYSNSVFSPDAEGKLTTILRGKIKTNDWVAEANSGIWEGKWLKAILSDGSRLTLNRDDVIVNGDSTNFSSSRYTVRLADGGFFQYSEGNDYSLIFPNGDKFTGSFKKVPLPVKERSVYEIWANPNKKYKRSEDGPVIFEKIDKFTDSPLDNYFSLMSKKSSDFELWDGTYTYKSGQTERVKNGQFPDRILATYIGSNDGIPSYSSLIQNAGKLDSKEASNEYTALCNKSFWEYIGKSDISELDKELFKQSSEYNTKFEQYQNALSTARYYAQITLRHKSDYGKFSTNKATFQVSLPYDDENHLPVLYFYNAGDIRTMFPISSSCKKTIYDGLPEARWSESVIAFDVPSTNLEFLKYLQESFEANELGLLMIFKPGRIYEIDKYGLKGIITTPVALYLINSKTNTVLYDLGKYIDRNFTRYGTIFRQIISREKEADRTTYHKQAKRIKCPVCSGTGYLEDQYFDSNNVWTTRRNRCTTCYGRGYIDTHEY